MGAQIEYVGFTSQPKTREYTLRIRMGASDPRDIRLAIPIEAFLSGRVRYQDAPEICFLIVQREVLASEEGVTAKALTVTDADLAAYRAAHAPKTPQRRPRPA